MMRPKKITELGHLLIKDYLKPSKIAIDMTLGNGFDSLYLAKQVKEVHAFEIQEQGIINSKKLFAENNINNVIIHHESHINIDKLEFEYQIAIFNLGYLPGSDKTITTQYNTTILALEKLLNKSSIEVILLVVYPGHENGYIESIELNKYINNINNSFRVIKLNILNATKQAPYIILIEKK